MDRTFQVLKAGERNTELAGSSVTRMKNLKKNHHIPLLLLLLLLLLIPLLPLLVCLLFVPTKSNRKRKVPTKRNRKRKGRKRIKEERVMIGSGWGMRGSIIILLLLLFSTAFSSLDNLLLLSIAWLSYWLCCGHSIVISSSPLNWGERISLLELTCLQINHSLLLSSNYERIRIPSLWNGREKE